MVQLGEDANVIFKMIRFVDADSIVPEVAIAAEMQPRSHGNYRCIFRRLTSSASSLRQPHTRRAQTFSSSPTASRATRLQRAKVCHPRTKS